MALAYGPITSFKYLQFTCCPFNHSNSSHLKSRLEATSLQRNLACQGSHHEVAWLGNDTLKTESNTESVSKFDVHIRVCLVYTWQIMV